MDRLTFVWRYRFVAKHHQDADDCEAGYRDPLAPCRFQIVLALEIAAPLRPTVEIRRLIREMSIANPLWGAPRIHAELLKLGIEIGQTSIAEYMAQRRGSPSQGVEDLPSQPCASHCRNGPLRRADNLVPAARWFADHGSWPAADPVLGDREPDGRGEWIANQLTEACGWEQILRYLIRDRDRAYGGIFVFGRSAFETADVFPLNLAKRLRRTAHRLDLHGMH